MGRSLATHRSQESSHLLDSISCLLSLLSSLFHLLSSLLHLLSSFNKPCCQTIWAFQAFFFLIFSPFSLLAPPAAYRPGKVRTLISTQPFLFSLLSSVRLAIERMIELVGDPSHPFADCGCRRWSRQRMQNK